MDQITLGGGCFWCLEAVFQRVRGVEAVQSGYAGGQLPDPSYKDVCRGDSGHAEVVQVHFDPRALALDDLFELFFNAHDPTTLNRQGNDVGPQYRSIILFQSPAQQQAAQAAMARAQADYDLPLVTELAPLETFYPAEVEHRDYYNRHQTQPYCQWVIHPKLAQLQLDAL
ncbi:peptide-methionine (S)-S-oxide reductase MsrA [Gallaecimonas xiamenensis]|uniref:Peptide methionine sulfoxide reductase MsrA n=1 Tax=Gallaecimonas xiamenensis 3-C-1 TaxID=745411 RepID=K2JYS6_9GAMM|nr:peptide-methionine (S)-S-oxide reductase MsrA [Gallaecimonas xiamenensis]EKE75484.1 peptide methionine sulfoxide reductase msrA [Gallaecimonas xiamenensis 3-C-1]